MTLAPHRQTDPAEDATLEEFVLRATAFVGVETNEGQRYGSATLLSSRSQRPVLLTAAHVAADFAQTSDGRVMVGSHLAWNGAQSRGVRITDLSVCVPATGDDVALVLLPRFPELEDELRPLCVAPDRLRIARSIERNEFAVICGFPAQFAKPNERTLGATAYMTKFKGSDRSAMSFEWDSAVGESQELINLRAGYGISGGAVWRFLRPLEGETWVPTASAAIVGVAHRRTDAQAQLAVPTAGWYAWAQHVLAHC